MTCSLSLKGGFPEIDYARLVVLGEFKTLKTAQNQWGALKKKLVAMFLDTTEEGTAVPSMYSRLLIT